MRKAELVMALIMGLLSIGLMWKSTELPITWIPGSGPGGGAFPFWLAAGMLACSIIIFARCVLGISPIADSEDVYMDSLSIKNIALVAGSLIIMVALIHFIGVYISVPLFLIYYLKFIGSHNWTLTGSLAIAMPIATFFFFEIALKITLPKGITEPLFYPLYDIFM
ncbi:MAG: tripartite tricarboxylate transporter TctB family protein [Pseudomonadota bacterium]|nr:tripartite tricarboxylate transporter TctB family protein [Pseudomonadota bacterium]